MRSKEDAITTFRHRTAVLSANLGMKSALESAFAQKSLRTLPWAPVCICYLPRRLLDDIAILAGLFERSMLQEGGLYVESRLRGLPCSSV
jgi:hypothetical protein